jgi:hypothetical protein
MGSVHAPKADLPFTQQSAYHDRLINIILGGSSRRVLAAWASSLTNCAHHSRVKRGMHEQVLGGSDP